MNNYYDSENSPYKNKTNGKLKSQLKLNLKPNNKKKPNNKTKRNILRVKQNKPLLKSICRSAIPLE